MPRFRLVNGNRIQFTAEEETVRDAEEAQWLIDKQAREDAEAARLARIESAKTKLQNLGLTLEEVQDSFNI